MKRGLALIAVGALAAGFTSCGGEEGAGGLDPTGANVQAEVFNKSCAFNSCHGGGSPSGSMNLEAPAFANIVGVPSSQVPGMDRVTPGDPGASYLFLKLTQDAPAVGDRMPNTAPLNDERIELVRAWISAGAPTE